MNSRRKFIKSGLLGIAGINLLPAINSFGESSGLNPVNAAKNLKLRFAIASDGHYAQPDTNSDLFYQYTILNQCGLVNKF